MDPESRHRSASRIASPRADQSTTGPAKGGRLLLDDRLVATRAQKTRALLGPYFERAGFTDREKGETVDLFVRYTEAHLDAVALQTRENLSTQEWLAVSEKARLDAEAQLVALLGAQRASDVLRLFDSRIERTTIVADAVARCASQDVPLAPETADALAILCYESHIGIPLRLQGSLSADQYQRLTRNDSRAIAGAEKMLTAEQLALFKQILANRYTVK